MLDETIVAAAAAERRLDVLQFLCNQQPKVPWGAAVCTAAASQGHLDVLIWLQSQAPHLPWDTTTINAAASKGHAAVFEWLWHRTPTYLQDPTEVDVHVRFLQSVWELLPASGKDCFLNWAGCSAACHRNVRSLKWVLPVDPDTCSGIVLLSQLNFETDAVGFMHRIGCLDISRGHQTYFKLAMAFPALMGDVVGLKRLKEVMIAHSMLPTALTMTSVGRHLTNPGYDTCKWAWEQKRGPPDYTAAAEWILDCLTSEERALHWHGLCGSSRTFLAVELQAHRPSQYPKQIMWPAATHGWAAANVKPPVLRWLLAQQGLAPEYTTVHHDCSNARLLLLVHGHHWRIPAELADRLPVAEKRRMAFHGVIKHQQTQAAGTACLASLPTALLKSIAVEADVDFSWSCFPPGKLEMRVHGTFSKALCLVMIQQEFKAPSA